MTGALTTGAALLLGLVASGHCIVMCGGISAALGIATARRADGRPQVRLLVAYQFGRILSYTLAGLLIGGALGAVVSLLDIEAVRRALRAFSALALLLGALVVFGRVRDPGAGVGRTLWPKLAPLGRRLLPVNSLPRATAFGMVWGWMPCGIVYTVLLIASLQVNALDAAATMAAFGLGTAPAMLATAFGAHRFLGFTARPAGRRIAGTVLVACALLTVAAPWLVSSAPMLHGWLPFDCSPSK
jgi:sulfite exporter TauE/SafE